MFEAPAVEPSAGSWQAAATAFLLGALVAAAVLAAFLPSLRNGFVPLDDEKNFILNEHYRGLTLEHLRWMFTSHLTGHYIPLTWVTLALDYQLWGMRPFGYHLTSLLLHLANSLLVLGLTWRLLAAAAEPAAREREGRQGPPPGIWAGAATAALVFAVHPLRVESVAWISERRDVLCGFFALLALHAYLSAARARREAGARPDANRTRAGLWLAATLALYAAALLAKGIALPLPVALLALDVAVLARLPVSPRRWLGPAYRAVLWEKLPFLAVATVSIAVTLWAAGAVLVPAARMPLATRLAGACFGLAFYLEKTLLPVRLPFFIVWSPAVRLTNPAIALPAVALAAAALASCLLARRSRVALALCAAGAVYAAFVLPVSGLLQAGPQLAAHRYTYLACLPWAILAGAGVARLLRANTSGAATTAAPRPGALVRAAPRRLAAVLLFVLVGAASCGLILQTRRQVALWHDSEVFSLAAIASAPTAWQPRFSLATTWLQHGRWADALHQLRIGLAADPGSTPLAARASLLLATCPDPTLRNGPEAVRLARMAVRATASRDPWALLDLAAALAETGRFAEATAAARQALPIAERYHLQELIAHLQGALAGFSAGRPLRLTAADWGPDRLSP